MTPEIDPDQPREQAVDEANRDLVERFFAASERGDGAALAAMVDDDVVMEWPQSGEQFRGPANMFGAMAAVEVKPVFAGQPRLVRSGHISVLMVPLPYGDDILQYVAVLELGGGRIRPAA